MSGFIKLHRQIVHSDLWLEEPFTRGQAFADLILLANYKDGYLRVNGQRIKVKRGQVGWSINRLSDRWQWSRTKVNYFLSELIADGMILLEKDNRKTILTICNYSKYQDNQEDKEQQKDNRKTTEEQQKNPNKEVKEVKEIYNPPIVPLNEGGDQKDLIGDDQTEKPKTKSKRATRVDDFELTDNLIDWTVKTINENGWDFGGKGKFEFEKFKDYWQSKGELKKDWNATWRNWIRNGLQRGSLVGYAIQPQEQKQPRQKRIGA